MQELEPGGGPPGASTDYQPGVTKRQEVAVERPVWKRSHVIWFLVTLSLVPGFVAAGFREDWAALPPGVRMTAYVVSGILIAVSCTLMLREDRGAPASRGEANSTGDRP